MRLFLYRNKVVIKVFLLNPQPLTINQINASSPLHLILH